MNILTNIQKEILLIFGNLSDSEVFYLTGGTALSAFYLNHRRSNDLDFFTPIEDIIKPFSIKLINSLKEKKFNVSISKSFHSFFEINVELKDESTIIHIALDSPFRFDKTINIKEFHNLQVDSLLDIAVGKILSIYGRALLRDFIDIYFLVKEKFKKEELIEKAKLKDFGFDLYWFGIALQKINEFDEKTKEMYLLEKDCSMEELKDFFNKWLIEIYDQIKE